MGESKSSPLSPRERARSIAQKIAKSRVANQTITDTTFACELYFDNTFAEQTAKAILGFYNEQNKLVQFALKDITVKPGKVDLNFDIETKPYSTYKLMLWEGMDSMRPLVDVR